MSVSPRQELRARIARRDAMLLPGCPNALTARIAADLGYEAVYVTGAGVTNTFLGLPDLSFVDLSLLANHVAAIRNAVTLPIIVDADTGFGNAVNVGHTVKVLERAGADCIQIEDQVFPKRCGHFDGKEVTSREEFVTKIRAAADARIDSNLLIMARTDAIATNGFEEAIERANAAVEAGADAVFVEGPRSGDEIRAIPASVNAPAMLNLVYGGNTPMMGQQALADMGYAIVLYANAALQAGMLAMQRVLGHIKETGSVEGMMDALASFNERQRIVDKPLYDALEQKYATQPVEPKRV